MTFIEQKSLHVDLDKPEERQGRLVTPFECAWYFACLPRMRRSSRRTLSTAT